MGALRNPFGPGWRELTDEEDAAPRLAKLAAATAPSTSPFGPGWRELPEADDAPDYIPASARYPEEPARVPVRGSVEKPDTPMGVGEALRANWQEQLGEAPMGGLQTVPEALRRYVPPFQAIDRAAVAETKHYGNQTTGWENLSKLSDAELKATIKRWGIDDGVPLEFLKNPTSENRVEAQRLVYGVAQEYAATSMEAARERDVRGQTVAATAVAGAENMLPYMAQMALGAKGFIPVEAYARYKELRHDDAALDENGNLVMTREGAGRWESLGKAIGGAVLGYAIERGAAKVVGKKVGGVGAAAAKGVDDALGGAVSGGLKKAGNALYPSAVRTAVRKAGTHLSAVKERFPKLHKSWETFNRGVGLGSMTDEIFVEEGADQLVDAILNLSNQYEGMGLRNVPEAATRFAEEFPSMVASMYLIRGGQYSTSAAVHAVNRMRRERALKRELSDLPEGVQGFVQAAPDLAADLVAVRSGLRRDLSVQTYLAANAGRHREIRKGLAGFGLSRSDIAGMTPDDRVDRLFELFNDVVDVSTAKTHQERIYAQARKAGKAESPHAPTDLLTGEKLDAPVALQRDEPPAIPDEARAEDGASTEPTTVQAPTAAQDDAEAPEVSPAGPALPTSPAATAAPPSKGDKEGGVLDGADDPVDAVDDMDILEVRAELKNRGISVKGGPKKQRGALIDAMRNEAPGQGNLTSQISDLKGGDAREEEVQGQAQETEAGVLSTGPSASVTPEPVPAAEEAAGAGEGVEDGNLKSHISDFKGDGEQGSAAGDAIVDTPSTPAAEVDTEAITAAYGKHGPRIRPEIAVKNAERLAGVIRDWTYDDILDPANQVSRAVFEEITGHKLPKGLGATRKFFAKGRPVSKEKAQDEQPESAAAAAVPQQMPSEEIAQAEQSGRPTGSRKIWESRYTNRLERLNNAPEGPRRESLIESVEAARAALEDLGATEAEIDRLGVPPARPLLLRKPPEQVNVEEEVSADEVREIARGPVARRDEFEVTPEPQRFEAVTPRGDVTVRGRWKVVEADTLVTSDDPAFDQELQPRDRTTAEAREQVASIAAKPDAKRLMNAPTTDIGAPIVDGAGQVISGNGRTMGIRGAYEGGKGLGYKSAVVQQARALGIDASGMKRPVLVRELLDTGETDLVTLAELSNRKQSLERSESETAEADAKALGPIMGLFNPDQSGDVRAASNHEFLKAFAKAAGVEGMRTSEGGWAPALAGRVRRAVLAAVFQQARAARKTIADAIENAEGLGIKRILDAIMMSGGQLLKLADAKPRLDLTPDLGAALSEYIAYRKQFIAGEVKTLAQYLAQRDMFQEDRAPIVVAFLEEFERRPSVKAVRALLDSYVRLAQNVDTATGALFGDAVAETTPAELLEVARGESQAETGQAQEALPGVVEGPGGNVAGSADAVVGKGGDGNARREVAPEAQAQSSNRKSQRGGEANAASEKPNLKSQTGKTSPSSRRKAAKESASPESKSSSKTKKARAEDRPREAFSATRAVVEREAPEFARMAADARTAQTTSGQVMTLLDVVDILRAVPGLRIVKNGEDWEITAPNGETLLMRTVADIPVTLDRVAAMRDGYGARFAGRAMSIDAMFVPVELVDRKTGRVINLADLIFLARHKGEKTYKIRHELVHWAKRLGLWTPEEWAGLVERAKALTEEQVLKRVSPEEELTGDARTIALRDWVALSEEEKVAHMLQANSGVWGRIARFFQRLFAGLVGDKRLAAGLRGEDAFRSGKLFERKADRDKEKYERGARFSARGAQDHLAPNGKPSNLSRGQWGQVRSPAFKRWFGDWEKAAHKAFLDGPPVASMRGDEVPRFEKIRELVAWVAADWLQRRNGSARNPVLGDVRLDGQAARDSAGHGLNRIKAQAFYLAPEVIERGHVLGLVEKQDKTKPDAYLIAAPVSIGDATYYGLVEVRRDVNSQRLYVHEALAREQAPRQAFKSAAVTVAGARPHSARGAIATLLHDVLAVKPEEVSKAVDANGEPLLAYHGRIADFTAFDRDAINKRFPLSFGLHFTDRVGEADAYADEPGGNVLQAFLSAKRPLEIETAHPAASMEADLNRAEIISRLAEAQRAGTPYDSVIIHRKRNDEYDGVNVIVFEPTQVKSALANKGTFSALSDDIRFSATPSPWYYSALGNTVRDGLGSIARKDGTVSVDQVEKWLSARQQEGKFKAAELEWSGLLDWLKSSAAPVQDGRVAVADVSRYLDENGVQVEDSSPATPQWRVRLLSGDWEHFDSYEEAERALDAEREWIYETSGTVNEDEDVITVVDRNGETIWEARRENIETGDEDDDPVEQWVARNISGYGLNRTYSDRDEVLNAAAFVLEAEQEALLGDLEGPEHDEEGGAKYADESYNLPGFDDEYYELRLLLPENRTGTFRSSHYEELNIVAHTRFDDRTSADGRRVLFLEEIQSDWAQLGRKQQFKGYVPRAPFVEETKAWVALVLKRMIAWAVEHGHARMAWTTGDQQADRWRQLHPVAEVAYWKDGAEYLITAVDYRGEVFESKTMFGEVTNVFRALRVKPADLEVMVGKDIARQIREGAGHDTPGKMDAIAEARYLRDGDLFLGGEGMRGFYNQIVPRVANEVLKKLGGGKVTIEAVNIDGEELEQPGFDITDGVRESAAMGLPLFSARAGSMDEHGRARTDTGTGHRNAQKSDSESQSSNLKSQNSQGSKFNGGMGDPRYSLAWHGSPHTFDRFSMGHIGTGEGAQAYGYGLYFAGKKEVAEWYRDKLSGGNTSFHSTFRKGEQTISHLDVLAEYFKPGRIVKSYSGRDRVISFTRRANQWEWHVTVMGVDKDGNSMPAERPRRHRTMPDLADVKRVLEGDGWEYSSGGRLYQVNLKPTEDEYLLWDAPLPEQSEKVKAGLRGMAEKALEEARSAFQQDPTNNDLAEDVARRSQFVERLEASNWHGRDVYEFMQAMLWKTTPDIDWVLIGGNAPNAPARASQILRAAGIRGIKYLNGASRATGDGDYNYVIFDDADVEIQERYSISIPDLAEAKTRWDEARHVVADWFNDRGRVRGLVKRALTRKDTNAKGDLSWWDPLLGTMMWYSEKIPALKKMWDAAVGRQDNLHAFTDLIMGDVQDGANDASAWIRGLRDLDKGAYAALGRYLFDKDREAVGYVVQEDGPDVFAVMGLPDANGKRKELARFNDEDEAWLWAYEREADEYAASLGGGAVGRPATTARRALLGARLITHRSYGMLRQRVEDLDALCKAVGRPLPLMPNEASPGEPMDLWAALRQMGDRRGYYMPRIRRQGRYVLHATKDGVNPIRKHYDTTVGRAAASVALERDGYAVTFSVSNRPSEEAFLEGQIAAINDLIEKAMDDVRRASIGETSYEALGMKAIRADYTRKDGKKEKHLIIQAPDTPEYTKIFMEFGGQRYDDKQTGTGMAWHWVKPSKKLDQRILRALAHTKVASMTVDVLHQQLLSNLSDVIHSRGSRAAKIGRTDATGTDVWIGYEEDTERALLRMATGISGGTAKNIMAKDMVHAMMGTDVSWDEYKRENLPDGFDKMDSDDQRDELEGLWSDYEEMVREKRLDSALQPVAFKEALEFMREMLRNEEYGERMFNVLRGVTAAFFLSRPASAAVNLTALPTVVIPAMSAIGGVSMKRSPALLARAARVYTQHRLQRKGIHDKPVSDEDAALFDEIRRRRWDDSQYRKETLAALQGQVGRGWTWTLDKLLVMFSTTEALNRASTIAAAYWGIKEKHTGKWTAADHEAALTLAHEVSEKAHGNYTKGNLPSWARGSDARGIVGRSVYLFQNYTHNYLQLLPRVWKQDKAAFAWMMASPMVLGGVSAGAGGLLATTVVKAVGAVLRAFGVPVPDDIFASFYAWLGEVFGWPVERVARTGVVGLAGADIRGSTQIHMGAPTDLLDLAGAVGGAGENIYYGLGEAAKGDYLKAAEKIAPSILSAPIRALREYSRGVTYGNNKPLYDASGAQVHPGAYATVLRGFGFNPAAVSEESERHWSRERVRRSYADARSRVYDQVKSYVARNGVTYAETGSTRRIGQHDPEGWMEISNAVNAFNERVRRNKPAGVTYITDSSVRASIRTQLRPPKTKVVGDRLPRALAGAN